MNGGKWILGYFHGFFQVLRDPIYKTLFFYTTSGRSMCNWEYNTVPREGIIIKWFQSDGYANQLLPDEPAKFTVYLEFISCLQSSLTLQPALKNILLLMPL